MGKFIFGKKKNVYIIDLEKTAQRLQEAKDFLKQRAASGEKILFVGTKKQIRGIVKELADACGMPYVVERWVGGFMTNFPTVQDRVKKYLDLLGKKEKGEFDRMPGKEVVRLNRELKRMEKNYSGVVSLNKLPECIYVIDPKKEVACIREAIKLSVPIVSLIDTDADPEFIDYPIPGNDDAIKSVRAVTAHLVEAINEGLNQAGKKAEETSNDKAVEEKA